MSIGALAVACAMPVYALDVGSVKVPETVTVGGKALVLLSLIHISEPTRPY